MNEGSVNTGGAPHADTDPPQEEQLRLLELQGLEARGELQHPPVLVGKPTDTGEQLPTVADSQAGPPIMTIPGGGELLPPDGGTPIEGTYEPPSEPRATTASGEVWEGEFVDTPESREAAADMAQDVRSLESILASGGTQVVADIVHSPKRMAQASEVIKRLTVKLYKHPAFRFAEGVWNMLPAIGQNTISASNLVGKTLELPYRLAGGTIHATSPIGLTQASIDLGLIEAKSKKAQAASEKRLESMETTGMITDLCSPVIDLLESAALKSGEPTTIAITEVAILLIKLRERIPAIAQVTQAEIGAIRAERQAAKHPQEVQAETRAGLEDRDPPILEQAPGTGGQDAMA